MLEWYFAPKRWEGNGKIYERLGVLVFKRALLTFLGLIMTKKRRRKLAGKPNNYFIWDRSPAGLLAFERYTRKNEAVHLLAAIPIPYMFWVNIVDHNWVKISYYIVLLLLNTYAICLQRYNRCRVTTILNQKVA